MPDYDQIVIGTGSSALTFLYAADHGNKKDKFSLKSTLVLGGPDLWAKASPSAVSPFAHDRLGQNPDILQTMNNRSAPKANLQHRPGGPGPAREWQTIDGFNEQKEGLKDHVALDRWLDDKKVEFQPWEVLSVKRTGSELTVTTSNGKKTASQVVIASGPGPSRVPEPAKRDNITGASKLDGEPLGYKEILDANEYLWKPQPSGVSVCVDGGSATASWAVQRAIERKAKRVIWIARSGFLAANPAGRNTETILTALKNKWMHLGTVFKIEVVERPVQLKKLFGEYGDSAKAMFGQMVASGQVPRLHITLKDSSASWGGELAKQVKTDGMSLQQKKALSGNLVPRGALAQGTAEALQMAYDDAAIDVHQYVYAHGADPTADGGAARMIDKGLMDELLPRFDPSRFGQTQTVVAFATPDETAGQLWVVGAVVMQNLGNKRLTELVTTLGKSYKEMADVLSKENSPPEGVPLINASMSAVMDMTQNTAKDQFNWKVANVQDLYQYLLDHHGAAKHGAGLSPLAADQAAKEIAAAQSATNGGFNQVQWEMVLKATLNRFGVPVLKKVGK